MRHVRLQCYLVDLQPGVRALHTLAFSLQKFCVLEECQLRDRGNDESDPWTGLSFSIPVGPPARIRAVSIDDCQIEALAESSDDGALGVLVLRTLLADVRIVFVLA